MSDTVEIGKCVVVNMLLASGESDRGEFEIVAPEFADGTAGLLSSESPFARALLGKAVGERVPYAREDIRALEILEIREGARCNKHARDRDTVAEIQRRIADETAIHAALTSDGWWGVTGPELDNLIHEEKK
jgi:hypothetical protein